MKYFNLSSSIYKTRPKQDGSNESFVNVFPFASYSDSFKPNTFQWTVLNVNSNFKNSTFYKSYVNTKFIGPSNIKNPLLKIRRLQEGEVVFVQLHLEASDGQDTLSKACNITAYRGDPVNSPFNIFYPKNGKLNMETVYDAAIEMQMLTANFDSKKVFPAISETVQGSKETIGEHLAYLEGLDLEKDLSPLANSKSQKKQLNGQEVKFEKVNFAFVKDELAFYAHGRSLDNDSIDTLNFQNPRNFIYTKSEVKPEKIHVIKAYETKRKSQHPGFNSFINPMLNPYLTKGKARVFFPGRSGHVANTANQGCSNNNTTTGGCQGYPASSNNNTCASNTTFSQGFCSEQSC